MMRLTGIEFFKIISKPRSYIGFAAVAMIVSIIQFAFHFDARTYWDFLVQQLDQSFQIEGLTFNGNMVCFLILQTLIVQMPLLVALVAGDSISGEVAGGTIRSLLTKPVSRTRILWAKWIAVELYTLLLVLFLGCLAWIGSLVLFGNGDMVVMKSDAMIILREGDTAWRFITAFAIAFLSLSAVAALSFMLSAFAENSIVPIIMAMSIVLIFTIIGTMDIPLFNKIKPYLFTTHMIIWRNIFEKPLPMRMIIESIVVLAGHIITFLSIAFYHFNRKDIIQ